MVSRKAGEKWKEEGDSLPVSSVASRRMRKEDFPTHTTLEMPSRVTLVTKNKGKILSSVHLGENDKKGTARNSSRLTNTVARRFCDFKEVHLFKEGDGVNRNAVIEGEVGHDGGEEESL